MKPYPELRTDRLTLRGFVPEDAPEVQRLVGARQVARTLPVPHPYEDGMAEEWIASHRSAFEGGRHVSLAVTLRKHGALIGCITLDLNARDENAELGYWIGAPYWGRGYATEAVNEMLCYGFEELGLHRVHASHLGNNPASGKVLQKVGMSHEGTRPEHYERWGEHHDCVLYGLLASDWRKIKVR